MKIIVAVLILILIPAAAVVQEVDKDSTVVASSWEKNLRVRFFVNHIYIDNWTKGGDNAFNWKSDIDGAFAKNSEKVKWDNIVRLRYEQSRVAGQASRINQNELSIRSALIIKQRKYVNPFFGATMLTQITTGYKYDGDNPKEARSDFWDPVTLTQSFGADISGVPDTKMRISVDYSQKIADKYVAFYSIDDPATPETEKIKTLKSMTFWSIYQRTFNDKFSVKAELEAKYPLESFSTIIVNYIGYLDYKLFSFLNFGIQTEFRYDKEQSRMRQLKNSMGLTFLFDLF